MVAIARAIFVALTAGSRIIDIAVKVAASAEDPVTIIAAGGVVTGVVAAWCRTDLRIAARARRIGKVMHGREERRGEQTHQPLQPVASRR